MEASIKRFSQQVAYTSGIEDPSIQFSLVGLGIAWYSGHVTYSAYPPPASSAITSSPIFLEVTFFPISSIIPLHSSPKISLAPGGGGYSPFF